MPTQPNRFIVLAVACALAQSAGAAGPAELEEVVVTAALRPLPARELPAGVSVLAGRDISDAAVVHLEELLPQLPSLSWAGASSRPRYFQLRGIGELEQYQGAPNPSIGFLVDEIDFSGIGMVASTFDVEQVEVLRGPQGTRYGANALGGLIKVKTRDPAATRELGVEAGFGDDGLWTAGIVAGGALPRAAAATGAWRAVFQRAASDGFRRNAWSGRDDTNGRDETSARLKFRMADGAGWRGDLALLYADFDNRYDAFAIDNSLVTYSDRPGRDAQRSRAASLDLAFDGRGGPAWRSVSTWAESDIEASFDADWGNAASWGAAGPYDFFSRTLRTRRNLSQDFRLESATGSWVAGIWASRLEETNRIADDGLYLQDAFLRILDSRYRATSAALYGQADWQAGPATTLGAGLRLEERRAEYDDSDGLGVDPRDRLWGGELSLAHTIGENHRLWATLARGYRAGGFNIGTSVPADRQSFDPEYLWTVELGWKGGNRGESLDGDANLFYVRREHQQVATSLQPDPQDPLTFIFLTDNAASGEAWGAEAAARWRPVPVLEFAAGASWMNSRYLGYRFGERSLDGRDWAHAPEWKLSLATTWRHPAGWMARLDLSGEAGYYFDTSHDQESGSRLLANLRAGYEAERWSLHAWCRNLSDERYPVRGFYFENEPPDFPTRLYLRWGDPRQFGLTARYSF